ncbi:MAG TPA: SDR family NAD(P)-dependent oxidoreductase [Candidatus Binatia bacterium]|jgi:NAD(P)-dependent dehydrogenase (short-subunit alcohol dehydrogenase family)
MASSDEKILRGKVALVTGGSRGIGRAIAAAYVQNGASVFICGRNVNDIEATLREMRQIGGVVDGLTGDVGKAEDVEHIVDKAVQRFGAIDVLVNNASILGPREPIANYPLAAWNEVIRINLTGLFLITRAILPIMLERRSGSIINVTSGVGRRGKARWGAYAVSKAGLENLTQVLADEVSQTGLRVNSVNPAATRTRMRAEAYPAEDPLALPAPEEITPIFVYLASDASAGVTGQSLEARDWLGPNI